MTLREGRRVRLAADVRLTGSLTVAGAGDPDAGAEGVAGFLSLASGTEGTVERVDEHAREQSHGVREYLRLKSLLDDFGSQMPPGSRGQLEEQVGSLEAEWTAYQERSVRVTVRVRLDNGFVLDEVHEELFTAASA
ncbi:hypothetical protein AB0424_26600 [Streptomyces sp. NPDC051180]|uniref:hypothetical protein n=1 Tax=Streptomyces sp. NPDC051180 TaxID=3155797 RepID=UPI00344EFE81